MSDRHNKHEPKVLAVDDEVEFTRTMKDILEKYGQRVDVASSGYEALQMLSVQTYDLVILDLNMRLINGLETLRRVQKIDSGLPVIVLTADTRISTVVEAVKLGAYDYFAKPINWEKLNITINNALTTKQLRHEVSRLQGQLKSRYNFDQMVGNSRKMQEVFRSVERIIDTNVTIYIEGESGTGKELLARAIHFNGPRKNKNFVAVNCAAIPDNLLESELFGHEKGSFTGASSRHIGKFEQARGGTIFLDEIGEMRMSTQVKILRVLQEHKFQRVGGTQTVDADFRLISATNQRLEEAMKEGTFREDLYYRICVYPIYVPPLRQRRDDISELVTFFLERYNKKYKRKIKTVLPKTMEYLRAYDWPGNVRELENVLERSFLNAADGVLRPQNLPITLTTPEEEKTIDSAAMDLKKIVGLTRTIIPLKELEKEVLLQALRITNYNMSSAAGALGIGRTTLYRKLQKYRIPLRRD